ncbi:MAG: diacylglycerol kinase family protein [Candidatus Aadella gelida]|nr:diacylglycerol kinase family protein [Candidatus Aadella gelida]
MRTLAIVSRKKQFPGKARIINSLKKDLKADIHFIEKYSDISGIVRKNRSTESVICCGGDGTISEVINNIDLETQKLGVIPSGRGNGLARTLGVKNPSTALKTIKNGKIRAIDLIACEFLQNDKPSRRYAVSTIGTGRIVLGAHMANQNESKGYLFTSIRSALNKDEFEGTISIGENAPQTLKFSNFIANNTKYIGNFYAFPKADIHDSLMDFTISRKNSFEQILETLIVLCRVHIHIKKRHPDTVHGQTNRLCLKLKNPAKFMIDGEIYGPVNEINFHVFPGKLKLFAC